MLTRSVFQPVIRTFEKLVRCIPRVLFTNDVKKIKGAAHKNGLKNATDKCFLIVISLVLMVRFL